MNYIKISYRLLLVTLTLLGLYMAFTIPSFMSNHILEYYTFQSNILVLIFFLLLTILNILELKNNKIYTSKIILLIKYSITVDITITFLVFQTLISGNTIIIHIANLLVHYVVPLMTIIDFFVFDQDFIPKENQHILSVLFPLIYFTFIMLRPKDWTPFTNLDGTYSNYPYFFLDVDKYGWFNLNKGLGVFYWFWIILVGIIIIGFIICTVKKYIVNKNVGFLFKK